MKLSKRLESYIADQATHGTFVQVVPAYSNHARITVRKDGTVLQTVDKALTALGTAQALVTEILVRSFTCPYCGAKR